MKANNPKWMRLDNSAKIYPAARNKKWSSLFRLSATIDEKVNPAILQTALEATLPRFPGISMRLRSGLFWYYLEQIKEPPRVKKDDAYPCTRMGIAEIRKCAFRVLYYNNRIAVEFFHSLTDGNGGLVFLKTLVAEYLCQSHNIKIPFEKGVLDREQSSTKEENEDSFLVHEGPVASGRSEHTAYHLHGTKTIDGFIYNTTGIIPAGELIAKAKSYGVTLTTFLTSVMIASILKIQNNDIKKREHQKPVKVLLPVNLRQFFKSDSLRNFVLYITPGVDPRLGDYTFEEILKSVHHQLGSQLTSKNMGSKITANVRAEKNWALKIMPLFIKNFFMKMVYNVIGERKSCITISNLGNVQLPEEMNKYVKRMDFILGAPAKNPCNCAVLTYNNVMYINFIRSIEEPTLEHEFFTYLIKLGIPVKIESNQR